MLVMMVVLATVMLAFGIVTCFLLMRLQARVRLSFRRVLPPDTQGKYRRH